MKKIFFSILLLSVLSLMGAVLSPSEALAQGSGNPIKLQVTSPKAGDVFYKGQPAEIVWDASKLATNTIVYLQLKKGGRDLYFTDGKPVRAWVNGSLGRFAFSMADYAGDGNDFTVKLYTDQNKFVGESGKFTIKPTAIGEVIDLAIRPFYITEQVEAGKKVTFAPDLINTGSVASGKFKVQWKVDGTIVSTKEVSSIAARQTAPIGNAKLEWTATEGYHKITLTLDSEKTVTEANEKNNAVTFGIKVSKKQEAGKPDLAISITKPAVVDGPLVIKYDETITVRGQIKNMGQVTAPAHKLTLISPVASGGPGAKSQINVPALAPGKSYSFKAGITASQNPLKPTQTYTFIADEEKTVGEDKTALANNRVTLETIARLPDIYVESIENLKLSIQEDGSEKHKITASVSCKGDADCGPSRAQWKVDGTVMREGIVKKMTNGSDRQYVLNVSLTPGTHKVLLTVNSDNAMPEIKTENTAEDSREITITVPAPSN